MSSSRVYVLSYHFADTRSEKRYASTTIPCLDDPAVDPPTPPRGMQRLPRVQTGRLWRSLEGSRCLRSEGLEGAVARPSKISSSAPMDTFIDGKTRSAPGSTEQTMSSARNGKTLIVASITRRTKKSRRRVYAGGERRIPTKSLRWAVHIVRGTQIGLLTV